VALQVAHTADLPPAALQAARSLTYDVFGAEMTESDWEHALGGVHALIWEGPELIGHASVIQRRLIHGGRALRAGYVEAVAVRADRRRRGHGAALMGELERVIGGGYELGALGSSVDGALFYRARGWQPWRGATWALTPQGVVRTADEDDGIYVLPVSATLDLDGELTADYRDGELW
jgi:aminoglycoside 2'-N-acetyltransferase I